MESDVLARFEQIETSHRNLEHQMTEFVTITKQVTMQLEVLVSRHDKLLIGDGQTDGTLVRMKTLEKSTESIHKRLDDFSIKIDKLSGRPSWAVLSVMTLLSSACVGLLVSHFR